MGLTYNRIQLLLLSGILGSLLMFVGDMLLYYAPVSGADFNSIATMSARPMNMLIAGGMITPIAVIFSIIGGYTFYLIFRPVNKILAKILFILFAMMFIIAGAYHAVFANYGIAGRIPEPWQSEQLALLRSYLKSIYYAMFLLGIIWTILLFYLVIFKRSIYPIWLLLITPTLLILLRHFIKDYVPYPLGTIIYGGWMNLSFLLFFLAGFLYFRRGKTV